MVNAKAKFIAALLGISLLGGFVLLAMVSSQVDASNKTYNENGSIETTGSPSPTPSASPTPVPPASKATVHWAKHQHARAIYNWALWNKARKTFKLETIPFLRVCPRRPPRLASEDVWLSVGHKWQRRSATFQRNYRTLRHRMLHPGGPASGVKWLPLARWVGWPESTLSQLATIIYRESSGRPTAYNPSGASGLLQLMPGWYQGDYYNFPNFNPFNPELNLYYGYRGWKVSGWTPWALTAY